MGRVKKVYPYDFKTGFGITASSSMSIIAGAFISSYFLIYLTDYAGLGIIGATIAPIILAIGRIFDAVNDPLQGWLIDVTPKMKMGKYKFYILLSILISAAGISGLYSIPGAIKTNVPLLYVWILFFYLLFDLGASLNANFALIQTMGANDVRRSKLMLYQRLLAVFLGAAFSSLLVIVNAINSSINNFGKAFSITTVLFMVIALVISLPGILMVKQGDTDVSKEKEEKVRIKDVLKVFKSNKAFLVHFFGVLVRNFVYTFMTATMAYYTKWAYCVNFETGEVDNARLGTITMATTIIMMLPMLVSAIISPMVLKKIGSNVKVLHLANWLTFGVGILTFVLQLTGVLQLSFIIFAILMGVLSFGNGLCFVPTQAMWIECIDYNQEMSGKPMGGTISALSNFIGKAQAAISTLVVGWVLLFIGYEVDSTTGNYIGDVASIPPMLNWFVFVCAILPAIFAIGAVFIYSRYPLKNKRIEETAKTE
ncbi:MAG: Melibiose carrier protein [Firmicutes bacterium ADurb.Bin146]|nr:MAG: Melibiose carrier protein [Firmicutes bacterium ADurb.Bin146]